jgi:hypothetical protein
VDDAALVRRGHGIGNLDGVPENKIERKRPFFQALGEGVAFDRTA